VNARLAGLLSALVFLLIGSGRRAETAARKP
jgi:hypothetical protein